jgi:hypothetical protein
VFFTFPEDARWNPDPMTVEFGVEIGEYRGVVRVPRRVFQHLLRGRPCLNAAWKPTIFTGSGLNLSPKGRFVVSS